MSPISPMIPIALVCLTTSAPAEEPAISGRGAGTHYAFAFFRGDTEEAGMLMAVSEDGVDWTIVNRDRPVFRPPFGRVLRDPAISQGPDGRYHLVWTVDWNGNSFGYAWSDDMVHWQEAREIPIMAGTDGTYNVWAPELVYDDEAKRWMLYWASSVEGRYPTPVKRPNANNRMYCAFSTDLKTFTEPQILFAEHIVNDTRIFKTDSPRGQYCMVVKLIEKPGHVAPLYLAFSDAIDGPYTRLGAGFISGTHRFCEGPAVIRIGDYLHCYFDLTRDRRMACVRSKTLTPDPWEDVTHKLTFPSDVKHGDIIRVPKDIHDALLALDIDTAPVAKKE